ncbi:hypothetical protein KXS07_35695 [Inquilinus limosus]
MIFGEADNDSIHGGAGAEVRIVASADGRQGVHLDANSDRRRMRSSPSIPTTPSPRQTSCCSGKGTGRRGEAPGPVALRWPAPISGESGGLNFCITTILLPMFFCF